MLVGITPTGVIPLIWAAGSINGKEIVKQFGLLNFLEQGDAVMSDKGFFISDIVSFKKSSLLRHLAEVCERPFVLKAIFVKGSY